MSKSNSLAGRTASVSSTFFISDLHLDPARPAVTAALAGFLSGLNYCRQLYILGDLFELWPGDDDDSPLAIEVTGLLRNLSATGTELFIMHGNRDFLLAEAFCRATGARLLADPTVIDLYGIPTLLMHGDSLCTRDTDYQQFRAAARQPAWQHAFLQRGLEERRALALHMRGLSGAATRSKSQQIMDVTPAEVDSVMQAFGVSQLIHGHTHRPARHDEPFGTRWVLGEWGQQGWVIEASPDSIDLYNIDIFQ